jgi:hypothetical protein
LHPLGCFAFFCFAKKSVAVWALPIFLLCKKKRSSPDLLRAAEAKGAQAKPGSRA